MDFMKAGASCSLYHRRLGDEFWPSLAIAILGDAAMSAMLLPIHRPG